MDMWITFLNNETEKGKKDSENSEHPRKSVEIDREKKPTVPEAPEEKKSLFGIW
jgi:hypothetical protein